MRVDPKLINDESMKDRRRRKLALDKERLSWFNEQWYSIHGAILEILQRMEFRSTSRDYMRYTYTGSADNLRAACQKILNRIEQLEEGAKDGLFTKTRRTEVSTSPNRSGSGNLD